MPAGYSGSRSLGLGEIPRLCLLVSLLVGSAAAEAQVVSPPPAELAGQVQDGPTGVPIPNVTVRVGDEITTTDADGRYHLEIPAGSFTLEVFATLPNGSRETIRQADLIAEPGARLERTITLVTDAFLDEYPLLEDGIGVPMQRIAQPPEESEPIDLMELWWSRRVGESPSLEDLQRIELPDPLPNGVRILRRYPTAGCDQTGDYPITEIDLDTYAAGVVTAEIGVFRALTTGEESQYEGFKTFAIAARAYALWFWARNPDAAWHLDDTACNQRYTDGPYPDIIQRAATETSGMYLVQAGTTATIDKFEYAASCGRCGSLPEYQEAIVPDITNAEACTTGGWCGHNNCAAHQDNPECPLEGRCLVRGICQWGSAERSANGDTYLQILGHYQPNLDVAGSGDPMPARLLGFVRAGSIESGENIAGATVSLDTGESLVTGANGLYTFDGVLSGDRYLSVRADGYQPIDEWISVAPGVDNWHSVAMTPASQPADIADPEPAHDTAPGETDPMADPEVGGEPTSPSEQPRSLSRFATVGPGGLEGGCGCQTASSLGARSRLIVLLTFGFVFLVRRQ